MPTEKASGLRKPQEAGAPHEVLVMLLAASVIMLGHGVILKGFSKNAAGVYMDEFFHERQTRHYCRGEFGVWDEKITTFPGLYFVATAWVKLLDLLPAWKHQPAFQGMGADPRFLFKLRLLNSVFNVATFCLLYRIYRFKKLPMASAATHALAWLLYPIIFFFGFLYYTDAGSLLLVLGMYDLAQRHRHLAAALVGSCAVIFRQTNAVWIAFVLGTSIVKDLAQATDKAKSRPWWAEVDAREELSLSMVGRFAGYLLHSWQRLVRLFWPYLAPLGAFAAFVVANGGSIVVGDRSNHKMTVHVAQLAYFMALCAGLHSPTSLLASLPRFPSVLRRLGLLRVCLIGLAAGFLLDRFTLSHPFLVSDNRHYTFYLWQRVFQRIPHTNVLLLPIYAVCAWWVLSRLSTPCSPLIALVFMVALCLTLLPAHLLEPRYFTTPLILASLEMPHPRPSASLLATILGFIAVNVVTIYIFLYRPFVWNDGSTARFMW